MQYIQLFHFFYIYKGGVNCSKHDINLLINGYIDIGYVVPKNSPMVVITAGIYRRPIT